MSFQLCFEEECSCFPKCLPATSEKKLWTILRQPPQGLSWRDLKMWYARNNLMRPHDVSEAFKKFSFIKVTWSEYCAWVKLNTKD